MRSPAATSSSSAAQFGQLLLARARRWGGNRGSSPFRLRIALLITVLVALAFTVLATYGVSKRRSSIEASRHAATNLIALQTIRVDVVRADSVASQSYLVGGQETAAQRADYLKYLGEASSNLVQVSLDLDVDDTQAEALRSVGTSLATYAGLVEQARANNRQGFPVGAAYQRQANALVAGPVADDQLSIIEALRTVEDGQRSVVNDDLADAHRAGVWLVAVGWVLVLLLALGGVWLALLFRRIVNVPLALAVMALLGMVIAGGATQAAAINDADKAIGGALTNADLVAQARAAAYDARSQEALTLINRGNGDANETKWKASSDIVAQALAEACSREDEDACTLGGEYAEYVMGHELIRSLDNGGNWDAAVAVSLGVAYSADAKVDTAKATKPFATFDALSTETLGSSQDLAQSELSDATDRLGAVRILVFVAGLLVALLAAVGYGQRLREYR